MKEYSALQEIWNSGINAGMRQVQPFLQNLVNNKPAGRKSKVENEALASMDYNAAKNTKSNMINITGEKAINTSTASTL